MNDCEAERIRQANDELRKNGKGGLVLVTSALDALGENTVAAAVSFLRLFRYFSDEDDLQGLHEAGSYHSAGVRIFWRITKAEQGDLPGIESADGPLRLTVMLYEEKDKEC